MTGLIHEGVPCMLSWLLFLPLYVALNALWLGSFAAWVVAMAVMEAITILYRLVASRPAAWKQGSSPAPSPTLVRNGTVDYKVRRDGISSGVALLGLQGRGDSGPRGNVGRISGH
jgi:hypothetical protein